MTQKSTAAVDVTADDGDRPSSGGLSLAGELAAARQILTSAGVQVHAEIPDGRAPRAGAGVA